MAYSDEKMSAAVVAEQYCNIFDNKRELFPYFLSNQVVLKWFGRTISGKKDVSDFVTRELASTTHILTSVEPSGSAKLCNPIDPCSPDSTVGRALSADIALSETDYHITQDRNVARLQSLAFNDEKDKKPSRVEARDVMMMGDSALNTCSVPIATKVEEGQGDCAPHIYIHSQCFFEARGALHFCRTKQSPTSSRNLKLVADTMKWERVCKLRVEYTVPCGPNPTNEFEIYLIMYEDNVRCRRNLLLEF